MNNITFAQVYKAHVDPSTLPPDAVRWVVLWQVADSPWCKTRGLRLNLDDLVAAEKEAAEIIGIPVEYWKEIDGYSVYRRDPVPAEPMEHALIIDSVGFCLTDSYPFGYPGAPVLVGPDGVGLGPGDTCRLRVESGSDEAIAALAAAGFEFDDVR